MTPPRSLLAAAALVALEAVSLGTWGLIEVIRALTGHPHDRGTAVLLGVLLLVYGLGVLWTARGLRLARRWSQTPAYLVQFLSIVIAIGQVHTLPGVAVPLMGVAVAALVAVSWPSSRSALGGV